MKKILYLTFCLFATISISKAQEIVTNKTIISLTTAGLSTNIIINKIKTAKCSFDLSTDGLIALKTAKVSDEVITVMLDKQAASGLETGNAAADSITNKLQETGIYYYLEQPATYTRLDPTLVTGNKNNSNIITGTTKSTSTLDGAEANLQTNSSPVFYFYFGNNTENKLNNPNAVNTKSSSDFMTFLQENSANSKSNQAFSPNDFKLIKLDKSKRSRSFETGKISLLGGMQNGISKNVVNFKYTSISSNLYKVYFPAGLEPGEYCFIYASSAASNTILTSYMTSINHTVDIKVFDFGVKKN